MKGVAFIMAVSTSVAAFGCALFAFRRATVPQKTQINYKIPAGHSLTAGDYPGASVVGSGSVGVLVEEDGFSTYRPWLNEGCVAGSVNFQLCGCDRCFARRS